MKISNLTLVCAVALLGGCGSPMFSPKPLDVSARGITEVRDTPYNCKVLGEAEGSDDATGYAAATLEQVRKGALNDLRNEAVAVVGAGKRITLYILDEWALCYGERGRPVGCPQNAVYVNSYRVRAQIFDCGEK